MLKDRDVKKDKKDEAGHFRMTGLVKRQLKECAESSGKKPSELLLTATKTLITEHYRNLESAGRSTGYSCHKCSAKIPANEMYYCRLDNIERFVESDENPEVLEIDTLDSIPTIILCKKCARKSGKFDSLGEPCEKDARVKGHERDI